MPELSAVAARRAGGERVLLCVVDDSEELRVALEYAALRSKRTGSRVALVYVIDLGGAQFQHWTSVADLMREEARTEAEQVIGRAATQVQRWSGKMPILYIREGVRSDEVLSLVQEDPSISILVLAANTGPQGPGPLVTALTQKAVSQLAVPVVIVPGNLSDEDIEALA